jgi:hypothetical protein
MAEQVERLAKRESRTTSELFREAFRMYRGQRLRAILDRANAGAREGASLDTAPRMWKAWSTGNAT